MSSVNTDMVLTNKFVLFLLIVISFCKPVEASFVSQNFIIGGFIVFSISMVCVHCFLKMQERRRYDARMDRDVPVDTSVLTIDNLYVPGGYQDLFVYEKPY